MVLHPCGQGLDAVNSARLSLPAGRTGEAEEAAREAMLQARYAEFRALCFVGKDLMRWMRQCMDFVRRDAALAQAGLREQSFADLLANHTPVAVAERFDGWGVTDYRRVVARAIGLQGVFSNPPGYEPLAAEFLENYYSYADALFACYQRQADFTPAEPARFRFSLYTSDEYLSTLQSAAEDEQSG